MRFRAATCALAVGCLAVVCPIGLAQAPAPDAASEKPNPAAAAPDAPPFVACPAGAPLGAVSLRVTSGGETLPFRTINHLSEGDAVGYAPVLRGRESRPGEVALVLIPEKIGKGDSEIIVTNPRPANKPQEWRMDRTISLAALVYGPAGLNRKKVAKFLSQDQVLVAQLADYADKTAQAEQLVAALSNAESSSASVNAALTGFASQYGYAVQIDRNAPLAAQAQTIFTTINPQLTSYNPLASSTAARTGQTASLATAAATLFFGSPVGLAAGGTAMLLALRSVAFPDTQFRASFATALKGTGETASPSNPGDGPSVNLCGQQSPAPGHTRVAYIWASRIPNAPQPEITIGDANYLPLKEKSPLPVRVPEASWKYLERARDWRLLDADHNSAPVNVVKLGNQNALEIDLTKAKIAPGEYTLAGMWDWAPFSATGKVHVAELSDFSKARLRAESGDKLLAKAGKVAVTLEGADFQFTTKVQLEKRNDEFATPEAVPFILPQGLRTGPQDHMDVQVDTAALTPGPYQLLVSQQDGKSHPVPVQVLPAAPVISNLPVIVNQGNSMQHFVLKGERLGLIAKLEAEGADLELGPAAPGGTERTMTVELKAAVQAGSVFPLQATLADRSQVLSFATGLEITGPLPAIVSSKLSLPKGIAIALGQEEFPAGSTLNAILDVKNIAQGGILRLGCADAGTEQQKIRIGEQTANWNLQQLSRDQLFLAFDTSGLPAGCVLQALIDNGRDGKSQPYALARVRRLPQIESFDLEDSSGPTYRLTGENLEMIEKAGWDPASGSDVTELPAPLPGPGLRQTLEVRLPDPSGQGNPPVLYVWIRGDQNGRATTVPVPATSLPSVISTTDQIPNQ